MTFSVRQLPQSLDSGVAARGSAETAGSVQLCLTQDLRTAVDLTNKAADLAGIVAQAICDAAPSGDFVIVNTVLCPIAGVLKGVAKVAEFITKVDDVCRLFEQVFKLNQVEEEIDEGFVVVGLRLDDIEGDIDILARQVSVDGLALQVGDVEAGVSDLDLDLDSVRIDLDEQKHDREEFQSLNLRISIEQLLGSEQNDRISLFQLPEAVGGKLENVREVVAMAILMNDDAGKNIDQALVSFAQGDTHFNNQEYSLAFSSYRQAYREAAQVGTSPGLGVKN